MSKYLELWIVSMEHEVVVLAENGDDANEAAVKAFKEDEGEHIHVRSFTRKDLDLYEGYIPYTPRHFVGDWDHEDKTVKELLPILKQKREEYTQKEIEKAKVAAVAFMQEAANAAQLLNLPPSFWEAFRKAQGELPKDPSVEEDEDEGSGTSGLVTVASQRPGESVEALLDRTMGVSTNRILKCPNPKCGFEYMREEHTGIRLCRRCQGPVDANPSPGANQ